LLASTHWYTRHMLEAHRPTSGPPAAMSRPICRLWSGATNSHYRDDTEAIQHLDELCATLIRGRGWIIKPGLVQIGDEQYG
jgi:hypothetical protein